MESTNEDVSVGCQRAAMYLGLAAAVMGGLGFVGWALDLSILGSLHPSFYPMSPLTGVFFVALGLILFAIAPVITVRRLRGYELTAVVIVLSLVFLLDLFCFVEVLTGTASFLESRLFPTTRMFGLISLYRISPLTAGMFFFAALATLFLLSSKWRFILPTVLGGFVAVMGLIGVVGYAQAVPFLYGGTTIPMALTTAIAFIALGLGLIAAGGSRSFLLRYMLGPGIHARILRIFLPISIILGLSDELLAGRLQSLLGFSPSQAHALVSLVMVVFTVVIISIAAKRVSAVLQSELDSRKRTGETLLQLSQAVEQSPTVIAITDLKGNIEFVNPQFTNLTGYAREEVIGQNPRVLHTEQTPATTIRELWQTITAGNVWQGEFVNRKKNGELFTEKATISPIKNKEGITTHYMAIKENITELKRSQAEQRESAEKYRTIFEHTSDAIMTLEPPTWNFTAGNEATLKMFKAPSLKEFTTAPPWVFSPEYQLDGTPSASKAPEMIQLALEKGAHFFQWTHTRLDGEAFPAEVLLTRITRGAQVVLLATVRDITERFNAAEKEKALQTQMIHTSRLSTLGEMAAGLAHELNQPLAGISLTAQMMTKMKARQVLTDEEIDKSIHDIDTCVQRMSKIIKHVRIFARQEALQFTSVNVNETIEAAFLLMTEQLRMQKIEVTRSFSPDLPLAHGEASQLEQVWINFISNARDAIIELESEHESLKTPYVGQLSVTTRLESDFILIEVRDNGIGMKKAIQEKAIHPFFTTKPPGKGTGLGLSIAHGIIESHQGTIEIQSEEKVGTAIVVRLPRPEGALR
ncbi:PAS domain S-box protein [Bdellovibrionota bacterium FG-2]